MQDLTYKPFPVEALPKGLQSFTTEGALAIGCDPASLALPALCTAAGIIGGSRRLKVKSTWLAPPILWGCILGESGTSKSPAMRLALAPLRNHEKTTEHELEKQTALMNRVPGDGLSKQDSKYKQNSTDNPPPASPRRILVSDATTEALVLIAKENPLGLLLARDELAGFLGDLNRYGGNDEAFFLSAYDGEQINVDRKTAREHIFVPQLALSIIGTSQPAIFQSLMKEERRQSGFLARFLLIEPPAIDKNWPDRDLDEQTQLAWKATIERLLKLPAHIEETRGATPWIIELSEEAHALYRDFYRAHNQAASNETGDWRAFLAKAEQLPLRLALILHHIHWAERRERTAEDSIPTRSVSEASPSSPILTRSVSEESPPFPIPTRSVSEGSSSSPILTRSVSEGSPSESLSIATNNESPTHNLMQIPAETMQSAITLTHWFIHEAQRVYFLLTADPKQRLALELETWITTRGGKTSVEEIQKLAPEKFRSAPNLPHALLQTLANLKRGKFQQRYLPFVIHFEGPQRKHPINEPPIEFHLTKKSAT